MRYVQLARFALAVALAGLSGGCSTVDFSQPEMALPTRFGEGADIRLTAFQGSAGLGTGTEGPALNILQDQVAYGMVRCSRPGPRLDLEVAADFVSRTGAGPTAERLIGVATWRDPLTRQIVGRRHVDVAADLGGPDGAHVNVSSDADGFGAFVPRGQLAAGEAFSAAICQSAFGWGGLPG
jgi:hypothetical protein